MKANIQIHPVVSDGDQGPTAWGLSVKQTLTVGGSIATGFVLYLILKKVGLSFLAAAVGAAVLPLCVLIYFLSLVVRKPASYAQNWCEWHTLRLRRRPLFNPQLFDKNER